MSKSIDITDMRFGALTVLSFFGYKKNKLGKSVQVWNCKCDCGEIIQVYKTALLNSRTMTQSCVDCYRKKIKGENNKSWTGYGNVSGAYWYQIKKGAKIRGIEFHLSIERASEIWENQKAKCALTGLSITLEQNKDNIRTGSLDRIDNTKGYVDGNCWWVHKTVNEIKSTFTLQELKYWCEKIHDHKFSGRPSWQEYGMNLARAVSLRSEDPYTKVGAVVTRKDNSILSVGFNGAPSNVNFDWSDRDKRRNYVIHAETNALRYCKPNEGVFMYVTHNPCCNCLTQIASYGIKTVYFKEDYHLEESKKNADILGIELIKLYE